MMCVSRWWLLNENHLLNENPDGVILDVPRRLVIEQKPRWGNMDVPRRLVIERKPRWGNDGCAN